MIIAAKMSGFLCQFCKGSLKKVHYPKLYSMVHLPALNVLLLSKDLTIILVAITAAGFVSCGGPKKSPRTSSIVQIIFFV